VSERYNRIPVAMAALCLGVALGASAQTASPAASSKPATATATSKASAAPGGTMAAGDKQFAQKAAMGGMAEVQLGQLAQQKAGNDAVKQFGSRMVQDHGKANDELKQIAGAQGVQLPDSLDKKHMQEMQKLQKLEGAAFDREYMKHMVDDHKKDVAAFEKESKSGKNAELKGFAAKSLPTLQEHLKLAQGVNDSVKGGKAPAKKS